MISVDATWEQVKEALSGDDYAVAFDTLEQAMREAAPPVRAELALRLAHLHSLYGDPAQPDVRRALNQAYAADASLRSSPLALALEAELAARAQGTAVIAAELVTDPDPLVRYHALCALALSARPQEALDVALPAAELPPHLRWRLRSWQADAHEALGQSTEAALLYAEAAHLASGLNRAVMLQEQAALLLQQGDFENARQVLERARTLYAGPRPGTDPNEEGLNLATWHYLMAQVRLNLGQPEAAQEDIREAARLEGLYGDPSYGVALVQGQVLSHLGRLEDALAAFEQALARAADPDRPYANHELGVALLDLDRPLEAREKLEEVLLVPDYPFHPEVLADIAECDYRLGRLPEAQLEAEQALAQGAVVPASVVLGNVALDYYHLDDALDHYERVVREAAHGTRDWVVGHQMAADVMAQQGFPDPAAAYAHAQQALEHTPESDDWHVTLRDHLSRAQALMGRSAGRTLN
ncbi:tetratricopeptide repeat protein [Deinococcus wulumuqiensis]|uniref:Tetratricopeptide repeat protein n=1 Tax=Deinococcus wulumuqiensis TaxID=980427 RepID=A0AAV4K689_9DEIO|nr:tetratricopeptide repeat protein [Deinococcus wulumuqiensis]QII22179.1 hypothetical protein G6R31_15110 [Deinococcus wulumuqiensis R12]GGI81199.1 hypothetical protein GCM10010914_14290 [Deinococcus wulumuqiensis]GGP29189.1 hypothetical protein GCM10008021_08400 [Deinococcus wulumuqiensis]